MNEADYWLSLEYRLCHEFAGTPASSLRSVWCDGFTPEQYHLEGPSPRIIGRAWIYNGRRQQQWEFTLFLTQPATSRAEIDWRSLLPPTNVTRWLAVDPAGKRIQIEPAAAIPDPA